MTPRRRFIAGAVCPACGEIDRTVLEIEAALRVRTCVACGHREVLEDSDVPVPDGRFGRSARSPTDVAPAEIRVLSSPLPQRHEGDPQGMKD